MRANRIKGHWGVKEYRVTGKDHLPTSRRENHVHQADRYTIPDPGAKTSFGAKRTYDCFGDFDTFDIEGHSARLSLSEDFDEEYLLSPSDDGKVILSYTNVIGSMTHYCENEGMNVPVSGSVC